MWNDTLKDFFPKTPREIAGQKEIVQRRVAWERYVMAEVPDLRAGDIEAGIRWASGTVQDANDLIPTPAYLVSWVRRVKWEAKQIDKKIAFDADKDEEKFDVHETIQKWMAKYTANKTLKMDDDYIEILDGDRLYPSDEYLQDGEWVAFGRQAFDQDGRPRRLTKYKNTRARRRVEA